MGEIIIKNHEFEQNYRIVNAEEKHFDILFDIFLEAASWLRTIGLRQWGHFLDGYGRDDVSNSLKDGTALLVLRDNTVVGTVAIQFNPDEWDHHIWGKTNLDNSIFIHRLAVTRSEAGKELGKKIINWIEIGIEFPENKHFIKLDCVGDNKKLNEYYRTSGFQYLGCSEDGHCKYQKEIKRNFSRNSHKA